MLGIEIRARACALVFVSLLSACGGGGGGGGGGTTGSTAPPAPDPEAGRLSFTRDNVGRAAGYPLWASEMLLRVGQIVADDVATQLAPSGRGGCPSGGSLQRDWADKDGSKTLNAGDELTLDYAACSRDPLTRGMTGRVTLTLSSVSASGDFTARLVLAEPGLTLGYTTGVPYRNDFRIAGQARLSVSRSELRQTLALGDGSSSDAVTIGFPGTSVGPDRISALRVDKTHRWDEARTQLELQMRYDSPELGGAFDVRTLAPLKFWLDTLPEPGPQQGEIQVRGRGGDEARVQIAAASGTTHIGGWMDQGGDGSKEAQLTGNWMDVGVVSGVLFADYSRGGRGNAYAYDPNEFSMRHAFVGGSTLPVDHSFLVQFTRPVAEAAGWRWRLLDKGRLDQMPTAGTEVAVQAEVLGALIKVKPSQPLRYSRRYELLVETGVPTANGQQVRATTGATLSVPGGSLGSFQTADVLNSRASYASPMTVKAGMPYDISALPPPADAPASLRYQWTQLGGTPLVITGPNERQARISLAAGAHGIGAATLRLTVSVDGAGNSESSDYVLRTVADLGDPWLSRLRVLEDTQYWYATPSEFWSGSAVGTLTATRQGGRLSLSYVESADPGNPRGNWTLELGSGDGQPLQPGRYLKAYSSGVPDTPAGSPAMALSSGMYQLRAVDGEFEIHELEADAAGRVTRLALDFIAPQHGVAGTARSSGAIRINSTRALPP